MQKPSLLLSACSRFRLILLMAAFFMAPAVSAQAGSDAGSHFGDRQVGKFGDPGVGHFGNPAAGNFDSAQMQKPAADAQAFGKVHNGKLPEASPYISLPAPVDSPIAANLVLRKSAAARKADKSTKR